MAQRSPAQMPPPTLRTPKDDWLVNLIEWSGGKLFVAGIAVSLIASVALIYVTYHFSTQFVSWSVPEQVRTLQDASSMVRWGQIGLIVGLLLFAGGMTIMFWGDIALPLTLFLLAVVYFTANLWLGAIFDIRQTTPDSYALVSGALGSLTLGGLVLGVAAIILQIVDVSLRIRHRSRYGSRGDLIKYGTGVKEEADYQNIFLGKCWQLPFCRKFVREKCPIYHSRRTCWKERVGCMCEEDVIRGAMEGNVIPRETVAAAKLIPYNYRLTPQQKAERCRQCVIYNEHQRHKYKLAVWTAPIAVALFYVLFRPGLLEWTHGLVSDFDAAMSRFTFATNQAQVATAASGQPGALAEFVLIAILLFILAQIMKVVEFCIFKLKI